MFQYSPGLPTSNLIIDYLFTRARKIISLLIFEFSVLSNDPPIINQIGLSTKRIGNDIGRVFARLTIVPTGNITVAD